MWYLNPRQVFDLSHGGPKEGLVNNCITFLIHTFTSLIPTCVCAYIFFYSLELYRKVHNLRILACGGDGTVSPRHLEICPRLTKL